MEENTPEKSGKRGPYLPRRTKREKKLLITRVLDRYISSELTLRAVFKEFGVGKSSFHDWVHETDSQLDLEVARLIRRTDIPVDYQQYREQLKEVPHDILIRFTKAAALYARGFNKSDAQIQAGANGRYNNWARAYPSLQVIDDQSRRDRVSLVQKLDMEARVEIYPMALDALKDKLSYRKRKVTKRKKGQVVIGNRLHDVDTITQELHEEEPELKAIEMVLKMEGKMNKKVDVDGKIEIISPLTQKQELEMLEALEKDIIQLEDLTDTE